MKRHYKILRSRKNRVAPIYWNLLCQSSPALKSYHGINFENVFLIVRGGDNYSYSFVEEEWEQASHVVFHTLLKEPDYLPRIYKEQLSLGHNLVEYSNRIRQEDLSSYSLDDLFNLYESIQKSWLAFDVVNLLPWFSGADPLKDHITKELQQLSASITEEEIELLLTCPDLSFSGREEWDLTQAALLTQRWGMESKQVKRAIEQLIAHFDWIPFGYDGPILYDETHYQQVLGELAKRDQAYLKIKVDELTFYTPRIKEKQQALQSRYALSSELWRLIEAFHVVTLMTDQRKEFEFQAHLAVNRVIETAASRLHLDRSTVKMFILDELREHAHNPAFLQEQGLKRLKNLIAVVAHKGNLTVLEGKEAENLEREIMVPLESRAIVKGTTVSLGKGDVVGKVKVVLRPSEMSKMETGDVLIASMTSPEFVPAMRKAAAVVTDEGGVTCHAAIVSRELGIPCIIATQYATRVFQDGETVNLDLKSGTVTKVGQHD